MIHFAIQRSSALVPTQPSTQAFTPTTHTKKTPGQLKQIRACCSGDPAIYSRFGRKRCDILILLVFACVCAELNMLSGIYDIYLGRSATKWLYYMPGRTAAIERCADPYQRGHVALQTTHNPPNPSAVRSFQRTAKKPRTLDQRPHCKCTGLQVDAAPVQPNQMAADVMQMPLGGFYGWHPRE